MEKEDLTYTIAQSELENLNENKALQAIVKLAGWDIPSDLSWPAIDGKIKVSLEFSYTSYRPRRITRWQGVKLEFSHASNQYKKTWRKVAAKDGVLDIQKLRKTIANLLEMYAQFDTQQLVKDTNEALKRQSIEALRSQCTTLGVDNYFGKSQVIVKFHPEGVQLNCDRLSPELSAQIIKLIKAAEGVE